jgi:hypothetical protein
MFVYHLILKYFGEGGGRVTVYATVVLVPPACGNQYVGFRNLFFRFLFLVLFGGLDCVGHFFAIVAHL